MDCRVLAFRQLPHQPKLFLEYLDHFEKVKTFYFHPPAMPEVTRAARKLDYPADRREEVSSILRKQNLALVAEAETLANRDRLEKGAAPALSCQHRAWFTRPPLSASHPLTPLHPPPP